MELKDVVTLFSTEIFYDVMNVDLPICGKVNPFSEVANSGASSQRRILETSTTQVIPTSRVVRGPADTMFIVADDNTDYWNGSAIRIKYPMLPVDVFGAVGSIGETLGSTQPDQAVYAYPYFVRREIDEDEMSDYFSGYEIYIPNVKTFSKGAILTLGSDHYRFKTDTWIDGAGFSVFQAVKLEDALQTFDVSVSGTTYNSVTDSYPQTTTSDVSCFVEPLQQDYEFVSPSFESVEVGDKAISMLKSVVDPSVSSQIGSYRVMAIRDFGTWVTCQCRNLS